MRKKLTFIMAASLLLGAAFYVSPTAWSFERQTPRPIPEDKIFQSFFENLGKSATYCEIVNDDSSLGYFFDGFDSGMSFAVYMDPGECASQPTYPFKITDVHFHLYQNTPAGWTWPVNIQINIREALGGDKCSGPNPEATLCSESFTFPVDSSFDILGRPINFSLSQYCCVNQPFFLEIKYLDDPQSGDSLPSLLMNLEEPPEDTCDNWVYYTHGYDAYYEWYDFWSLPPPGDAIIRATGYTDDDECEDFLWYWKADKPAQDPYPAPSGMPDFDQYQFGDSNALCGPTAVANCLWWFNAVPTEPEVMTPPDLIRLLCSYMNCDPYLGTSVFDMEDGLDQYFTNYGFDLYEHTYSQPNFQEMEDSLKKSQDIILLIGFWWYDDVSQQWYREGGHFVTMAGVCSESLKIAVSDPARDAAEGGWPGRVRPPTHPSHSGNHVLHNDPTYVSQDMYQSSLVNPFPSPANEFWEIDYIWWRKGDFSGMNVPPEFKEVTRPAPRDGKNVYTTEVEYAVMICPTTSGVEEDEGGLTPKGFELYQNHPNPFNNETIIKFDLQKPAEVNLTVFNILGQKVRTLAQGRMNAGPHVVNWDGKDEKGNNLSSGIYFYQLKAGEAKETKRLVLLK